VKILDGICYYPDIVRGSAIMPDKEVEPSILGQAAHLNGKLERTGGIIAAIVQNEVRAALHNSNHRQVDVWRQPPVQFNLALAQGEAAGKG
jgi:hypothetical protein